MARKKSVDGSTRRPFLKAYGQSWFGDKPLSMCSRAARGLWWEFCLAMHDCTPYGYLVIEGRPMTDDEMLAISSGPKEEMLQLLAELKSRNIYSTDGKGRIFSRKLVRDEKARLKAVEFGREGGNPNITTQHPHRDNGGDKGGGYGGGITGGISTIVKTRELPKSSSLNPKIPTGPALGEPSDPMDAVWKRADEMIADGTYRTLLEPR